MDKRHVVTCFIVYGTLILVLKRSMDVGSYPGKWAAVSGSVEKGESYLDAAYREISEEVGITENQLSLIATASDIEVPYKSFIWVVHPMLFVSMTDKIRLNWENDYYRWVSRSELSSLDTVPELATAFDVVSSNMNIF